ncbi:universal stress protein [Methanobacterium sp.]|uniref:universal stress protein n=1 Tax=Methanobacterium sp. TaxID=2164 RepID=UPI003C794B9F
MYKKILVPTDGSQAAHKAAKQALWIASKCDAEVLALYVIDTSLFTGLPTEKALTRVKEMLEDEGRKSFDAIIDMSSKCKENFDAEIKLVFMTKEGRPARTIRKTIEEERIDLVVMGTAGKHGMDRFLLGSVAEKVLRTASSPVLVVR